VPISVAVANQRFGARILFLPKGWFVSSSQIFVPLSKYFSRPQIFKRLLQWLKYFSNTVARDIVLLPFVLCPGKSGSQVGDVYHWAHSIPYLSES